MADYASLCVLSYQRPRFLHECLETLRHHAEAPFELIVHDDGSTDPDVYRVLDAYREDAISTIITNARGNNQGVGTAINRMFGMATGDPLVKIDQDLVFRPGWLRRVNEVLTKGAPRLGFLGLLHYHHEPVDSAKTVKATHDGWTEHTHILGSAFAMTRACWDAYGPFEEHSDAFAEDWLRMKEIEASGVWACGLPPEDLCVNVGMGPGPSTVVREEGGEIKVTSIHHGPKVYDPTAVPQEA